MQCSIWLFVNVVKSKVYDKVMVSQKKDLSLNYLNESFVFRSIQLYGSTSLENAFNNARLCCLVVGTMPTLTNPNPGSFY